MKILITGGSGYIAKGLYAGLKSLHNVTCITRSDFDLTNYINTLGDHKVQIKTMTEGMADAYVGTYLPVLSPLIGLKEGIDRVYNKLKI